MERKSFIKKGVLSSLGLSLVPTQSFGVIQTDLEPYKVALVKEFVLAGHFDLDKVIKSIVMIVAIFFYNF